MIAEAKKNAKKLAMQHDGAEEACKNMADDSEYEGKFLWAGRCPGITRSTKDPADGEDADRGEMWKGCWQGKGKKKSLYESRETGVSDPTKPYG